MKRVTVLALTALLCLSLFSCTDETNPGHYETPTPIFPTGGDADNAPAPETDGAPLTQTPAQTPGGVLPGQTPDTAPAVGP